MNRHRLWASDTGLIVWELWELDFKYILSFLLSFQTFSLRKMTSFLQHLFLLPIDTLIIGSHYHNIFLNAPKSVISSTCVVIVYRNLARKWKVWSLNITQIWDGVNKALTWLLAGIQREDWIHIEYILNSKYIYIQIN